MITVKCNVHAHLSLVKSRPRTGKSYRIYIYFFFIFLESSWFESYLSEFEGAVRVERRDLAGVFGDVAVKARRGVHEVLHVFIDALHFPLKPITRYNTVNSQYREFESGSEQISTLVKDFGVAQISS